MCHEYVKTKQTVAQTGAKRGKVMQWRNVFQQQTNLTVQQALRNKQTGYVSLH